jgi:hypothetical protein
MKITEQILKQIGFKYNKEMTISYIATFEYKLTVYKLNCGRFDFQIWQNDNLKDTWNLNLVGQYHQSHLITDVIEIFKYISEFAYQSGEENKINELKRVLKIRC